jgi:phosphatidylserine/phosphatidylglycerophosphate/cardiolipin synthase-like enzyme
VSARDAGHDHGYGGRTGDQAVSEWFLPPTERPCSEGNQVEVVVHGADYFRRVVDAVSGAERGDRVWFTDWRGDPDEKLRETGPTVGDLMADAAHRGVDLRALLWRSHSDLVSFSEEENSRLGARINHAGGEALLDQRVRRGGSHHQKILIVQHPARPADDVAFVGGIDLCHSRRDDAQHLGDVQRQDMDPRYGERPPWHDAAMQIRGPAVADVAATFAERWNDPTRLDHRNPYRAVLRRKVAMPRHPTALPPPLPPPPEAGPHAVQVLRTYPAKRPRFPFAPHGERSIARAYAHAFAHARRLVYVEDQYLWSTEVARTLAEALRREPALQVIAVVPRFPDQDGAATGAPSRLGQHAAIDMLTAAGGERFGVYDLVNEAGTPIYVHAKVCVVDDEWMTCGSDNFNRRSWTHDSEATCAVVDRDGRLPQRVRAGLWAEHLGCPPDDAESVAIEGAASRWRQIAQAETARICPHRPEAVPKFARLWARPMYAVVCDPDGRPLRLRLSGGF